MALGEGAVNLHVANLNGDPLSLRKTLRLVFLPIILYVDIHGDVPGCGPKHCNLTEGDVSGGGFFLSEPSSRALDHAGSSRTSRALFPTLGSSALSTSAPPLQGCLRRHLQPVGFDPSAPPSELGRALLGVRPSHGLALLQWGVAGGESATAARNTGGVFSGETRGAWASTWGGSLGEGQAPSTLNQL